MKDIVKHGDIVERRVESDGTLWLRQWIRVRPGLLHLVWTAPNGIVKRSKAKWITNAA